MGVYSQNRTSLAGIEVAALEGYDCFSGLNRAMLEGIQDDQELFDKVIAADFQFAEAAMAGEDGILEESAIQAINEGTVANILDKIKQIMQKLMAVVESVAKSFTAKLAGLLIRDNKTLVDALKKRINKTDFSKFEAEFIHGKGEIKADIVQTAIAVIAKYYNKVGTVATPEALKVLRDGISKEIETAYTTAAGTPCTAANFSEELHKKLFDEKPTTVTGNTQIIKSMNELIGYKKYIESVNKASKEAKKGAADLIKNAKKGIKNSTTEVKEGETLSSAAIANVKYDVAKAYSTTTSKIIKALMAEIRFEIKQHRALVVKAASYTPKHESVEYYGALTEASDFEVDTTFEEPGMPASAEE